MVRWMAVLVGVALLAAGPALAAKPAARADAGQSKLQHLIVICQENRSFDHDFSGLPYAPGRPSREPGWREFGLLGDAHARVR